MQFPFCALLPWREGLGSCPRGPMKLQSGSVVQYLHLAPCGLKLQEEDSISPWSLFTFSFFCSIVSSSGVWDCSVGPPPPTPAAYSGQSLGNLAALAQAWGPASHAFLRQTPRAPSLEPVVSPSLPLTSLCAPATIVSCSPSNCKAPLP